MFVMDSIVEDNGCVLAFLPMSHTRITIWSEDRTMLQKSLFTELVDLFDRWISCIAACAYQVDNIWWP